MRHQPPEQLLIMAEFLVFIQEFHKLYGIFRHIQREGRFLNPFNTVLDREGVPAGGGNESNALMAQLMQMTEAKLPGGPVVRNHIAGIEAREITIQQHQGIILQLHGQKLLTEKGLVLGKQDDPGNIQLQASLQQIILHRGIAALENVADIGILRKYGLYPIDHGQGK